tara:strand:+ start:30306 stop:34580 length:4275 start_codon:yes stop_codon:yes gene_type:complete
MYLIFDTETTGLAQNYKASIQDTDNWPRMVQLAWQLHDFDGKLVNRGNFIVKPDGYDIPFASQKIHGISTAIAEEKGIPIKEVLDKFHEDLAKAEYIIGHNIEFDINVVGCECFRYDYDAIVTKKKSLDTMLLATEYCALPGGRGGSFKWPNLDQLHVKLFGESFDAAHDAAYDVHATSKCFFGLLTENVVKPKGGIATNDVHYEAPNLEIANFDIESDTETIPAVDANIDIAASSVPAELKDTPFVHLHCRSQYSILQSTSDIKGLVGMAAEQGSKAVALVDSGNLYGAFHFVKAAASAGLQAIIGIELNICENHLDKSKKDDGFPIVLIAKNKAGYKNLVKLSSKAFTEGFYYVPRIDRKTLLEYKEDIIVLTGGLWGEVPFKILNIGIKQAEESFAWWKNNFGENFYAELQRHHIEEEQVVNNELLRLCDKYDVKYIATNNTYYTKKDSANAHDILLCVKDADYQSRPKKYFGSRGREFRFGLPNEEYYMKSPDEMKILFADLPKAILNIQDIVDKIEPFELAQDILLPIFDIPEEFKDPEDEKDGGKRGENAYLRHLTYEGAKKRYGNITDEIRERLDFELQIIANSGYPGYFLIVEDFIREARRMGVWVGPGRGSAAGSAVAYCVTITNVDPIKYDLLFERFLNPDRVSMPDIDIDFDDEGRQKVIDYVIDKYGSQQVAQIITYGTMAAKSALRDTARALELPLNEATKLTKLVPGTLSLAKVFGLNEKELRAKINKDEEMQNAQMLIKLAGGHDLQGHTIQQAQLLEGSVRNTGIHACGVIITPDDLTNFVPVAKSKDSEMYCTQFDNSVVEDAGLLKMDFLGLKTLTLIKDAIEIVRERHGIDIDPDEIPLDDLTTYELFQRGETIGVFQYESPGMQKHLKGLKPTNFADLIAMNALYRPGPMEYIPSFIKRKHGTEEIIYDLDACKEHLEETYGITVYQEQVMLLSQKLANFTKGEADTLRKAMGKKKLDLLAQLKPKFLDQGAENGHAKDTLDKIWKDWEAFASYAFNKSHSTCYAFVAFQTAYLKANYPAEYMASVLSNNLNDIKKVTFYMEECQHLGIQVLSPDVNESNYQFSVNKEGNIRFGMGAIKGVGRAAIESIVKERNANGRFTDIFDFFKRIDYKSVNKKALESLCLGGGFDNFEEIHRAQLIEPNESGRNGLDTLVRFGQAVKQSEDAPPDLFGDSEEELITSPVLPEVKPWSSLYELKLEREVVGFYITGHPLDIYKYEISHFCNANTQHLKNLDDVVGKTLNIGGTITAVSERIDKKGNPFGRFALEDYHGAHEFMLFGEDYLKQKNKLVEGAMMMVTILVTSNPFFDRKEAKIQRMLLMNELLNSQCKNLQIMIPADKVDEIFIEKVKDILLEGQGSVGLKFTISDSNGVLSNLKSNRKNYSVTGEKLTKLESIPGLTFKLHA